CLDRLRHSGLCHRQASVRRLAPRPLGIHHHFHVPLRGRFDHCSSHSAPRPATQSNRGPRACIFAFISSLKTADSAGCNIQGSSLLLHTPIYETPSSLPNLELPM